MTAIRTVVVDDEPLARERVKDFLKKIQDVQLVGEAGDGPSAIELIEVQNPDLVVLDVQMPGMDGFGVLRAVGPAARDLRDRVRPARDQAFEVEALDYL